VLSSESIRIKIQREIHNITMGRPGGNLRVITHPILSEVLKKKHGMIEKNVHRSVKLVADPQLTWEDYRIILE
jgi:ribonuclease G